MSARTQINIRFLLSLILIFSLLTACAPAFGSAPRSEEKAADSYGGGAAPAEMSAAAPMAPEMESAYDASGAPAAAGRPRLKTSSEYKQNMDPALYGKAPAAIKK